MFILGVLIEWLGTMAIKVFRNYWKRPMGVLAAMELAVFASALCLISLPHFDGESPLADPDIGEVLARALLFAPVLSLAMAATGRMVVIAIVASLVPELAFGREALVLGIVLVSAGSAGCHYVLAKLAGEHVFKKRIIVYGAGRRAATLIQKQANGSLGGFKTVGFIPAVGDEPSAVSTERRIELRTTLLEHCQGHGVTEIVVALDDSRAAFPIEAFLECRLAGIEATDLTEFLERETGQVRIDLVHPNWMVFSDGFRSNSVYSHLERMFDVLASLGLLLLTWPVMLLTVLAIKIEEGP